MCGRPFIGQRQASIVAFWSRGADARRSLALKELRIQYPKAEPAVKFEINGTDHVYRLKNPEADAARYEMLSRDRGPKAAFDAYAKEGKLLAAPKPAAKPAVPVAAVTAPDMSKWYPDVRTTYENVLNTPMQPSPAAATPAAPAYSGDEIASAERLLRHHAEFQKPGAAGVSPFNMGEGHRCQGHRSPCARS